eukprot:s3663_g6.t1
MDFVKQSVNSCGRRNTFQVRFWLRMVSKKLCCGSPFNNFRHRLGVTAKDDNEVDIDKVVKSVMVFDENAVAKYAKVSAEQDASTNAKVPEEYAAPENDNVPDKFEVTANALQILPEYVQALDIDKAIQIVEAYPDGEALRRQAESQLGGSEWSNFDRRALQALALCGVLLLLRGQVKSGLLLLIAVALVSKRSNAGSRTEKEPLGQQEQGRTEGTRATGQQDLNKTPIKSQKDDGANPKKAEEAHPPTREQDQGHPIRLSGLGGGVDVLGCQSTDRARPSASDGVMTSMPPIGGRQVQSVHVDRLKGEQSLHVSDGRATEQAPEEMPTIKAVRLRQAAPGETPRKPTRDLTVEEVDEVLQRVARNRLFQTPPRVRDGWHQMEVVELFGKRYQDVVENGRKPKVVVKEVLHYAANGEGNDGPSDGPEGERPERPKATPRQIEHLDPNSGFVRNEDAQGNRGACAGRPASKAMPRLSGGSGPAGASMAATATASSTSGTSSTLGTSTTPATVADQSAIVEVTEKGEGKGLAKGLGRWYNVQEVPHGPMMRRWIPHHQEGSESSHAMQEDPDEEVPSTLSSGRKHFNTWN